MTISANTGVQSHAGAAPVQIFVGPAAGPLNAASSNNPLPVINIYPSTCQIAAGAAAVFGQTVTCTATVTGALNYPTGTVTFSDGASVIATAALNGTGVATFATADLSVATHTISARYSGDMSFYYSTSSTATQTVNKASTTATATQSAASSVFGQSITFTAAVPITSPGAGTPTGTITFTDAGTPIGTTPYGNSTTLPYGALTVGDHAAIKVVYAGDTHFNGSTSAAIDQVVSKANITASGNFTPSSSVYGQEVFAQYNVTVNSPGEGTPTGTLQLYSNGVSQGTHDLQDSNCTWYLNIFLVGTNTITVVYAGDTNFSATTSATYYQTVNKASTITVTTSTPNPATTADTVAFTASVAVTSPGTGTPTGAVTFKDAGVSIGNGTLSSNVATLNKGNMTAGDHTITSVYVGSANFNGSTSAAYTQTVTS